jgi:hypothetical protein
MVAMLAALFIILLAIRSRTVSTAIETNNSARVKAAQGRRIPLVSVESKKDLD